MRPVKNPADSRKILTILSYPFPSTSPVDPLPSNPLWWMILQLNRERTNDRITNFFFSKYRPKPPLHLDVFTLFYLNQTKRTDTTIKSH